MNEKQLIRHLQDLAEIRPRKDWVILTKQRIFAQEPEAELNLGFFPVFRWKLAFVPVLTVFVVIGLFGFAQSTLPGDFFFPLKKIAETAQVNLSAGVEKPALQLKIANKRLEELNKIAENNQIRNLAPTIEEFQASLSQAAKDLVAIDIQVTSSDPLVLKELVAQTQKLAENKQKIETTLGVKVGETEEWENAIGQLEKETAAFLIADLEQRTLSKEDEALFREAKADFEAGNYSQALEKIWLLSNK